MSKRFELPVTIYTARKPTYYLVKSNALALKQGGKVFGLEKYDSLFVAWSFFFQLILISLFTIRRIRLDLILSHGWIFYALSLIGLLVSITLLKQGKPLSLWLGGFIFLIWAIFGYIVEYQLNIHWRTPIMWSVFIPYVFLYLGTTMFYWWPVATISRPLWFVYAFFFVIGAVLNATSH